MVTLKLIYLIVLAITLFLPRDPQVLLLLLGAHVLLWLASGFGIAALWQSVRRLRWFFLVIFLSYAFIRTASSDWYALSLGPLSVSINLDGLQLAALMLTRVLVLVIASAWVRKTAEPGEFVAALKKIRIPETVAISVDATLDMISGDSGTGGGGGRGRGRGDGKNTGKKLGWSSLRSGQLDAFTGLLERQLGRARTRVSRHHPQVSEQQANDIAIVLTVGLVVMGLKVLQVMPGLPVAPGHKNLLIVPLLLFAARATHMPFGATAAGLTTGIVSFLLGYGKFGVLEISHFVVPGILADLLMPLARARSRPGQLVQFALIGAILGLGRFSANFLVIVLAGAPWTAFVFYLPMLASQVGFGALSCLVSPVVVNRGAAAATRATEQRSKSTAKERTPSE